MSEQQTLDLLNEAQLNQLMMAQQKNHEKQQKRLKSWSIYCKRRGKLSVNKQYQRDLQQVAQFSTMKQFFRLYSSIKEPSSLEIDTKLFFFLKDCKPIWEEWLESGCLLIKIKFKDQQNDQVGARILNSTWQFLLFGLVGNNIPKPRNSIQAKKCEKLGKQPIIGLVLQRRQAIALIQVWYRNWIHAYQLTRLLEQDIKSHLNLKQNQIGKITMKQRKHKDSIQTNSTMKGVGVSNFKVSGSTSLKNL